MCTCCTFFCCVLQISRYSINCGVAGDDGGGGGSGNGGNISAVVVVGFHGILYYAEKCTLKSQQGQI